MTTSIQKSVMGRIDDLKSVVASVGTRHHGIFENPKTREPIVRPGCIGPVRHVSIDLRGHRSADDAMQGGDIVLALRILYDDLTPTVLSILDRSAGSQRSRREDMTLPDVSIWEFMRPVAARIDHDKRAVSIWAEVERRTATVHENRGRNTFGMPLKQEPQIRRDAVVVSGDQLRTLANVAIAEIAERRDRAVTTRMRERSTRRRIWTMVVAFMMLVVSIGMGAVLGYVLVPIAIACMTVMEFACRPSGSRLAKAAMDAVRDAMSGSRRMMPASAEDDAATTARRAVLSHAPAQTDRVSEALGRIVRLRSMSEGCMDASVHDEIASIDGDLQSTVLAYRRPARIAVDDELRMLTSDLATSIVGLGIRAEGVRTRLLHQARDGFDTQRRYLDSKAEHEALASIG